MNGPPGADQHGRTAIVVSSAATPATLAFARRDHPDALVIAADGGLAPATALGLEVDAVVGDFDSVDTGQLAAAAARGSALEQHPVDKDATDLELAVRRALASRVNRLVVVDSSEGRLDHFLATMVMLASGTLVGVDVTAYVDDAVVLVVRGGAAREVPAPVGATVTLLPTHGAAVGVTTEGLRYPLARETLVAGTTRGVSNVVERERARVAVTAGALLIVVPDARTFDEGRSR